MFLPVLLYYLLFNYAPMFGLVIAFKDFKITKGIIGSAWCGLDNFKSFFDSAYAWRCIRNTLSISILQLIFSFPSSIILALMMNEVRNKPFLKTVQIITYMPHFISMVIMCSIILTFVSNNGILNELLGKLGWGKIDFQNDSDYFYPVYIISGIWQGIGWGSIIYLSALAGIDVSLYEAAIIDGAGRFQKLWHITLPGIMPTIAILLILQVGSIMSISYEKILLLYNPSVYEKADVISTFIYRRGLSDAKYGLTSAVGLFNSVINLILLVASDRFSKFVGQRGLF
jgi:putative aldouronate transport system permease protein